MWLAINKHKCIFYGSFHWATKVEIICWKQCFLRPILLSKNQGPIYTVNRSELIWLLYEQYVCQVHKWFVMFLLLLIQCNPDSVSSGLLDPPSSFVIGQRLPVIQLCPRLISSETITPNQGQDDPATSEEDKNLFPDLFALLSASIS